MTLDTLPAGARARISEIRLGVNALSWLRAVGIFEGEEIVVLRRAIFGGPLHLRTGMGGEFALDRSLAASIDVLAEDALLAGE